MLCQEKSFFRLSFFVDKPISYCRMIEHKGEMIMNIFEDTDAINAILSDLADREILEPMVEPIDDPNNLTDFWDWADVVGIVDEFAPVDNVF